jgi:hypothetical protein
LQAGTEARPICFQGKTPKRSLGGKGEFLSGSLETRIKRWSTGKMSVPPKERFFDRFAPSE